jgi:hypothetical protein
MSNTALPPELQFAKLGVQEKLAAIGAALKNNDPLLEMHCQHVRKALMENEELVHILQRDEIKVLMAGMKRYMQIKLIEEASKTRKKSKVTADDL